MRNWHAERNWGSLRGMTTSNKLTQFRIRLYSILPGRGDAAMDLIDALSSNLTARSVVELSLNPAFRRKWPSVTRTVDRFRSASSPQLAWAERVVLENELRRAVLELLDAPARRGHWLIAVDGTPYARPHAQCLEDRSLVHRSDGTSGTPVTVGHEYSTVVALPERARRDEPAWVLPISSRRVPTTKTPATVAAEQVFAGLDDPELAWYEQLTVVMGDSAYSNRPFLGPLADFVHVVALSNSRPEQPGLRPPAARGFAKVVRRVLRLGGSDDVVRAVRDHPVLSGHPRREARPGVGSALVGSANAGNASLANAPTAIRPASRRPGRRARRPAPRPAHVAHAHGTATIRNQHERRRRRLRSALRPGALPPLQPPTAPLGRLPDPGDRARRELDHAHRPGLC